MLINVDVKSLEIHTAAYHSQDEVLLGELIDEIDLHSDNQNRFALPERRDAKFFIFRIIFGGTAAGFANDPNFYEVGFSKKQWQDAVDKFYDKYKGLAKWHSKIIQEVIATNTLVMPTGRIFTFKQYKDSYGEWKWPETNIKNYPVQSLGADLMSIYRVLVHNRLSEEDKEVTTVHDSVVVDTPTKNTDRVLTTMFECATIVPSKFKELFGVEYNLPFRIEAQVGRDMKNMEVVSE